VLLPLKDINPTRHVPVVTYALVALNLLAFVAQLSRGLQLSIYEFGLMPARLFGAEAPLLQVPGRGLVELGADPLTTLFTAMFMHGGLLHLGGNMLYLWIFGDNVESRLGALRFLGFYLAGGIAASLTHVALNPGSMTPMVGASGAVAAVLGAYWRSFPRARVRCLVFLFVFVTFVELPAALVLGWWILIQVFNGLLGLGVGAGAGGVAWFAHIGGFGAGLLLLALMGKWRRPRPRFL
jgi:membrane associated rhomboid family serine protease